MVARVGMSPALSTSTWPSRLATASANGLGTCCRCRRRGRSRTSRRQPYGVEDLRVSPCSGRGCRTAPPGSRRRSGRACDGGGRPVATISPGCRTRTARLGLDERILNPIELPVVGHPFHGHDLVPVRLCGEHEHAHTASRRGGRSTSRTRPAPPAVLRAREAHSLPQREEEALARPDLGLDAARR